MVIIELTTGNQGRRGQKRARRKDTDCVCRFRGEAVLPSCSALYYRLSKDFLEAEEKRLAGDAERQASQGIRPAQGNTSRDGVLENWLLKKHA